MPTRSGSRTTTDSRHPQKGRRTPQLVERRLPRNLPPTSPGEMLLEEFLKPLGISQSAFAVRLGVSFPRLNEIVRGKRTVTPDTALRLARVLGMSADFWLGLQQDWDLWHAMRGEGAAAIAALEPLEPIERKPR
jgi:antitoxin HigA-1